MKKNDRYTVDIIDIGGDGEGIARVDGQVVFVPYAIDGEKVDIQVINTKSKFAIAKILNIVTPSEYRREAKCPYFSKCGGCDIQHMTYEYQLITKKKMLATTLRRVGGIDKEIDSVVPCDREYEYRNKIALPIVYQDGKTMIGMYRKGSHKVVEITDCAIQMPFIKDLLDITKDYIDKNNIMGYDEENHKGILRHIVARYNNDSILVTLVVTKDNLPKLNEYYDELLKKFESVGLSININKDKTNVILGDKTIHKYGEEELTICENGIKYSVSNDSFMQVNDDIRCKIYNFVLENISSADTIVDLYSGAGVLTSMFSTKASKVYGIEIVPSAVNSANKLMKENGISNVTNICGDAGVELKKLSDKLDRNYTIVVDPPRKGLGDGVVDMLSNLTPTKIIYISCNPATLSRDLCGLSQKYDILSITPFDMFPETKHLETVVVLNRKASV